MTNEEFNTIINLLSEAKLCTQSSMSSTQEVRFKITEAIRCLNDAHERDVPRATPASAQDQTVYDGIAARWHKEARGDEGLLPPMPPIDDKDCIPYDSIRYIAGFTRPFCQRYALDYARIAVLQERQRYAELFNSYSAVCADAATALSGWKEAAIAWEVCASVHREFAKGHDALFTTRQSDYIRHADEARARYLSRGQRQS